MTLQASVLSSPLPLNAMFDVLSSQTPTQDIPLVNSQQEQQAAERYYLVSRIDDLCDCV